MNEDRASAIKRHSCPCEVHSPMKIPARRPAGGGGGRGALVLPAPPSHASNALGGETAPHASGQRVRSLPLETSHACGHVWG